MPSNWDHVSFLGAGGLAEERNSPSLEISFNWMRSGQERGLDESLEQEAESCCHHDSWGRLEGSGFTGVNRRQRAAQGRCSINQSCLLLCFIFLLHFLF